LFELLPGHRFDIVDMPPLIKGLAFDVLIAAKTFDSDAIMADLNERRAKVVISQHRAGQSVSSFTRRCTNGGI
jgi:hypothetical protein